MHCVSLLSYLAKKPPDTRFWGGAEKAQIDAQEISWQMLKRIRLY